MTAVISNNGKFRYCLTRDWDTRLASLTWVMLNPSTADDVVDDPTIRKCCGFARHYGYGGIRVVNLFAFRSTNPAVLRHMGKRDIIGPDNDDYIRLAVAHSVVIAAWGAHGRHFPERIAAVHALLPPTTFCLKLLAGGFPQHPLMAPYHLTPKPYNA